MKKGFLHDFGITVYNMLFGWITKRHDEKLKLYYASAFHDGRMLGQVEGVFSATRDFTRTPITITHDMQAGEQVSYSAIDENGEYMLDSIAALRLQIIQKIGGTIENEETLNIAIPHMEESITVKL